MTTATKTITLEETKQHKSRNSLWFVIHNKVYDVTKFIDEHPGGEEVLLEQGGKDASEIFDDVSHSADAKDLMKNYLVGDLDEKDRVTVQEKKKVKPELDKPIKHFNDADHSLNITWGQWIIAIAVSVGTGLIVRSMLDS